MTCNHCQEQLLHFLYDVLDPEERAQISQHLEECAGCGQARAALLVQQELLAEAAKESFPQVVFQPPAETPRRLVEPTQVLPRRERGFSWVRVAVAASVALFVFGGGSMGVLGWLRTKNEIEVASNRVQEAHQQNNDYQASLEKHKEQTKEDIRKIQEEINRLFEKWNVEATKVRSERKQKDVRLSVSAPFNIPAGSQPAVNFNVDNLNVPAPAARNAPKNEDGPYAQITIRDKENRTLFKKQVDNVKQQNVLKMPPLPLAAGANRYFLEAELFARDGKMLARGEANVSAPEYLTHLMTDRPMYRPGEVVRFRSLTLERFGLTPAEEDLDLTYRILAPNQQEIFKTQGAATLLANPMPDDGPGAAVGAQPAQPVKGPDGKLLRGIGAGEFQIPFEQPGGQYTISVSEGQNRFPPEKRTFLVSQWQMPRMNKEIKFHRSSYGPGEVVQIEAQAKRGEDGKAPLANHRAHVRAVVDGKTVYDTAHTTKADGTVVAHFSLPAANIMPYGRGSVSVEFHDGAGPETIVRPIPIVLNKLHVEFFPEGGDLIQGVKNKVYFEVRSTLGKPAELKGRIVDQTGAAVADLETLHDDKEEGINQGQGAFTFTPVAGKTYQLKIDTPLGVQPMYRWPATKAEGVILHLVKAVADDTIDVEVTSVGQQRSLMVGAYCRGRLLDERRVGAPIGKAVPVTLNAAPGVSGVYRITVYEIKEMGDDLHYVPRAERLTYRKGAERIDVTLEGAKDVYYPGDKAKLKLVAKNENGARTATVAAVTVRDLSLVKLADDKTDRAMPTHFLLTSEVRKPEDLENADVLLGKHPQAETALDLLLGTQGWRRFAEQDPARFQQQNPPLVAQQILNTLAQPEARHDAIEDVVSARVDRPYAAKAIKLLDDLAQKEAVENGPLEAAQRRQAMEQSVQNAQQAAELAQASQREYEARMFQYLLGGIVIGALLIGLGAIVVGVRRMGQGRPALAALVTGTALLLFLFMSSLAGVFYMIGSKGDLPLALNKQAAIVIADKGPAPAEVEVKVADAAPPQAAPPAPQAMAPADANNNRADEKIAPAAKKGAFEQADRPQMKAPQQGAVVATAPQPVPPPAATPPQAPPALPGGAAMPAQNLAQQRGGAFGNPANIAVNPDAQGGAQAAQEGQLQQQFRENVGARVFGGGFGGNFDAVERELRKQGNYEEIMRRRVGHIVAVPQKLPPLIVREYAHKHADNADEPRKDAVRRDFTETLYWQPALVLPGGDVEIGFDFSDSVTRYQVTVLSHSLDGRLGANTFELAARLPFSIDPKVPFEVSSTDKIIVPVAVKNDTDNEGRVELTTKLIAGLKTQDVQTRDVALGAKDRSRGYFALEPAVVQGDAQLRIKGTLNANQFGSDSVERSFKIVPDGFPIRGSASGLLEKTAVHDVTLPNAWVDGTLACQVQLFPSTLAELQKGLEGLLREPNGCFEQSSSSNYPNVLILNYMQEAGQGDPNVEKRARQLIQNGYQRITSFECIDPTQAASRRGYEWFGQTAPPHEALTAYGLLQFHDMANVYPVDKDMVARTTKYLLAQRDGQGGFKRNARAIDTFGRAPAHITDAYIVWALTDAGVEEDLTKELSALAAKAKESKDAYFVALVALGHLNRGKNEEALALAKKLKDTQKDDGHLEGTQTSITGSQGRDLSLETTALTVLAWLKANRPDEFHGNLENAVKWINSQRSGQGSFGATQSTILALKALIAHTRASKKTAEDAELTVSLPDVGGKIVAKTAYTAGTSEPITLTLGEGRGLKPGQNKVVIETTGKNVLPYTLGWSYQTLTPPSDAGCTVKLSAKLNKLNAQEGDTVKLNAVVENATDAGHGMTVAILGLPAGLAIPEDAKQLKELAKLRENGTKPGTISAWELRGRELVLYWRDLAPKAKIDVELDLVCRLPGTYRGPASRAYLYYNADRKNWIEPLAIVIDPQRVE